MSLRPLEMIWDRAAISRQDSDTAFFWHLLFLGEAITKATVAGMIACVQEDRDRHRYRLSRTLVRADGLGDWTSALEDAVKGPASQKLITGAHDLQREITLRGDDGWQSEAVRRIHECLELLGLSPEPLPTKLDLLRFFSLFVQLRNKTRGHGAPMSALVAKAAPLLEASLDLVSNKCGVLHLPWAFLHRNLSGKYRVTKLTPAATAFDYLKGGAPAEVLQDGVYLFVEAPRLVPLVETDSDAADFFFANGNFRGKSFELLSYSSDSRKEGDGTPYMIPATELPASETEGLPGLQAQGQSFGNLPPERPSYVRRPSLEDELRKLLIDDRHPVVTLAGRGGIGKTSVALTVLHELSATDRFFAYIWLSARDIDLFPDGPKVVRPAVLTITDIAQTFAECVAAQPMKNREAERTLAEYLTTSPVGPLLVIVDNFETLRHPADAFQWLDTYIRLPNKILITTRSREFRGDYPVTVGGMEEPEAKELVERTASSLGISALITPEYFAALYDESEGHPYITRVLLGEVARAGRLVKVDRLVASREEMLDALFERTFTGLSPAARHTFLLLSSWRSLVPEVALQAVLFRPGNERINVEAALDELVQTSLVEVIRAEADNSYFYNVPLAAAIFGRRKLQAAAVKPAVEADLELLRHFGVTDAVNVQRGLAPRVEKVFRYYAHRLQDNPGAFADARPMLEFIARRYPAAWQIFARLYQETGRFEEAKESLRRYVETGLDEGQARAVWRDILELCKKTGDTRGAAQAISESSSGRNVSLFSLSKNAHELIELLQGSKDAISEDEKHILVKNLLKQLASHRKAASPTDLSRLAWLMLQIEEEKEAIDVVREGLAREPSNSHLRKLASRLMIR